MALDRAGRAAARRPAPACRGCAPSVGVRRRRGDRSRGARAPRAPASTKAGSPWLTRTRGRSTDRAGGRTAAGAATDGTGSAAGGAAANDGGAASGEGAGANGGGAAIGEGAASGGGPATGASTGAAAWGIATLALVARRPRGAAVLALARARVSRITRSSPRAWTSTATARPSIVTVAAPRSSTSPASGVSTTRAWSWARVRGARLTGRYSPSALTDTGRPVASTTSDTSSRPRNSTSLLSCDTGRPSYTAPTRPRRRSRPARGGDRAPPAAATTTRRWRRGRPPRARSAPGHQRRSSCRAPPRGRRRPRPRRGWRAGSRPARWRRRPRRAPGCG
jgi:hypothetical protein